jgi:beta-lactamase class A
LTGSLPACGQILPLLSNYEGELLESLDPDPQALTRVKEIIPEDAQPALARILNSPGTVGLAAYRVGLEDEGAYLNADVPMPLASVVKIIHLVAYAEAVAAGELDPTSTVFLHELEAFYLPNIDLGAHSRALSEVEQNNRVFGNPSAVLLDEVPGMMIASSSNAATDYLHLLLGQETIEETAISLGLSSQTAPCPFLGQFLVMGNHVLLRDNSYQAWEQYIADPQNFGRDAMLLTEAFSTDDEFRQTAVDWRRRTRSPSGQTQRLFSKDFNAQGSASDYAALMAKIAQNGLSSGESSYITRRFLEWPMRFADNQALFSNLGYKNGSLPGILTTVYYAYPKGDSAPIVVALFFRDLEGRTSREMRNNLAQDELARWLLYDPEAIPALRALLPHQ